MYSELDMSCNPSVSLWGPGHAITTSGSLYQPLKAHTMSASSTPSSLVHTPAYSQTLSLESTMLHSSSLGLSTPLGLPTTVIAGQERHAQAIARPSSYPSTMAAAPTRSINPRQGGRRQKSFVDPCEIAPLKKRRIQIEMLNPDERDKVLQKREKNKLAAEKCRVKRREQIQHVRLEYDDYLESNEALEKEIKRLREEKDQLEKLLTDHPCCAVQQS